MKLAKRWSWLVLLACLAVAGCRKSQVDQALDSDANGYFCRQCQAKFYTAREVFPTICPECKKPGVEMVVGYVCAADQQVTLGPRSKGALPCSKCGQPTTTLSIPREVDFKAWGAPKRSAADVGG